MTRQTPFRALPRWLVYGAATVGGSGYLGRAPGTNGSIAGTLFYALVLYPLPTAVQLPLIGLLLVLALVFCHEAEARMGVRDPGIIVLDEFAAMPLVFLGIDPLVTPARLVVLLVAGFALFRFFDILKPLGIRKLQYLPGGLGVWADDVAAGLVACGVLHGLIWLAQASAGL